MDFLIALGCASVLLVLRLVILETPEGEWIKKQTAAVARRVIATRAWRRLASIAARINGRR
jgi:hypothetical protein